MGTAQRLEESAWSVACKAEEVTGCAVQGQESKTGNALRVTTSEGKVFLLVCGNNAEHRQWFDALYYSTTLAVLAEYCRLRRCPQFVAKFPSVHSAQLTLMPGAHLFRAARCREVGCNIKTRSGQCNQLLYQAPSTPDTFLRVCCSLRLLIRASMVLYVFRCWLCWLCISPSPSRKPQGFRFSDISYQLPYHLTGHDTPTGALCEAVVRHQRHLPALLQLERGHE